MKRILLIDDDMDDLGLFGEALRQIDASILFNYYINGGDALEELADKKMATPDLIFLDINMPAISGWQCLEAFKKETHLKDVPVLMYTTSSQAREIEMAKALGASGFITKPDDFNLLKKMLVAILGAHPENLAQTLETISR